MKRAFFLLATFAPFAAMAQLQSPNPEAGETFVQNVAEEFEPLENGGTTGQIFDLSALGANGSVANPAAVIDVATTPNGKVYAGADVAVEGGGQTTYYSFGDSYEYHGGVQNNLIVAYSDTEEYFPFPFNIGDTSEDTFASEYGTAGITVYRTGTVEAECISEGTLTLPGGVSYENVYRVHMTEVLVDSTFLGTYEVVVEGDYFMTEEIPFTAAALLNISTTDTPITGDPVYTETTAAVWMAEYVVDMPEQSTASWAMVPNPARDHITLVGTQSAEVVIYGMDGREWKREMLRPGLQAQVVNTADLPAGTYLVRMDDGQAQQLVIQR